MPTMLIPVRIPHASWPGAEWGSGAPLLTPKPQQYEIVPWCGCVVLLPALKALSSAGFPFRIYIGERKAAESSDQVLHLVWH